jgi:agmatinase
MSKEKKIASFNPNDIGDSNGNIFGLPFTTKESSLVIIPVPWEVTVSYSSGTANGPQAIYDASFQVDLYDPIVEDAWKMGIAMMPVSKKVKSESNKLRKKAEQYIELYASGKKAEKHTRMKSIQSEIHAACKDMNKWVKKQALTVLQNNQIAALVGGDHSTPLGLIQALAEKHDSFGILQIDAHADLRIAYEGFEYSHASIMYNALQVPAVSSLTQVGIRDYCEDEKIMIEQDKRIHTFFDRDIKHQQFEGRTWKDICKKIIATLPDKIYLSIDIDGLDPKLCPHTGTPVPGGFEFEQVVYLVQEAMLAGKKIIGFDINEVSPGKDEWDANVGARLLYKVSNLCMLSNGIKP